MLKFILTLLMSLTILSSGAVAESAEATADSLKANMKQANTLFKAIGASMNDPEKNSLNAKSAGEMADFFRLTMQQVPKGLDDVKGYQDLIQQCIDHSLSLQQAFLVDDNSLAGKIYQEMKELKSQGHEQYDP